MLFGIGTFIQLLQQLLNWSLTPFFNPSSPFSNMSLCSFKNADLVMTPLLQMLYITVESLAQCFLVDFSHCISYHFPLLFSQVVPRWLHAIMRLNTKQMVQNLYFQTQPYLNFMFLYSTACLTSITKLVTPSGDLDVHKHVHWNTTPHSIISK